jgi:hypothetical protein
MIELFDWYNARGQTREAGFLVRSIKNPASIILPRGFESSAQVAQKKQAEKCHKAATLEFQTQRERTAHQREESRRQAFMAFWESLSMQQQEAFESEAVDHSDLTKRAGYYRSQGEQDQLFKHYQTAILRDHYERTQSQRVSSKY